MVTHFFFRNTGARDHLELFLVSAVSSVLLLRFYLYIAHYPQLGGGNLHIAHMLYGGLLMLISIITCLSFLGDRSLQLSALLGGIGFGVFIDELGKFITKDNNYFFRPTVGLIYAIFAILYLLFIYISRRQTLSSEEYQLNVLQQFQSAVLHDMSQSEKSAMLRLLSSADQNSQITQGLRSIISRIDTNKEKMTGWRKLQLYFNQVYSRFWKTRRSNHIVSAVFSLQAIFFLAAVVFSVANNLDDIRSIFLGADSYTSRLIIGQLVSSVASGIFVFLGVVKLASSRLEAIELFRYAIVINLMLTEFFVFSRIQFGAIPGLVLNIVLLLLVRTAIDQEHQKHQFRQLN